MSGLISAELRQRVAVRADQLCEYCLLGFNDADRLLERENLIVVGRYPSLEALARIRV